VVEPVQALKVYGVRKQPGFLRSLFSGSGLNVKDVIEISPHWNYRREPALTLPKPPILQRYNCQKVPTNLPWAMAGSSNTEKLPRPHSVSITAPSSVGGVIESEIVILRYILFAVFLIVS